MIKIPKLTKIDINSTTIKDDDGAPDPNLAFKWEYEKTDDGEISEIDISMPRSVFDTIDISNGQSLEVWGGNTTSTDKKYFNGFVDDIIPEGALVRIIGKNAMIQLVRKNVNKIYDSGIDASAGEISEIVEDLIETYGGMTGTVQSSGTEDGRKIDVFKCVNTDIWERINTLKKALDWQIRYDDENDIVYFEPRGYTNSGLTLTVGIEIVNNPEWDYDTTNMINDLRVDGATTQTEITESGKIETTANYLNESILLTKTPDIVELLIDATNPPTTQVEGGTKDSTSGHFYYVDRENKKIMPADGTTFTTDHFAIINYIWSAPAPIHMRNQASVDSYGLFQKTIELSDIGSVADAESRAVSILNKRSVPFVTGKLLVRGTSLPNVGELVDIIDNKSVKSPSGQYIVLKVTYSWPSGVEEIEVGDKAWRISDWQMDTEERIKRLEEQFVRNQDLLMELVNIQNTGDENLLKPKPRYRKVLKEDYNTTNNILIWGNVDHGIWNTDKWGTTANAFDAEADHFIQQFENKYTEDFIDTDFFDDPNSTGDWLTGVINVGQTLRSLPFDFNNSIVSVATATFTESGAGTPTFYLSADGGSNWESVTSGTAHTFTNTGTSLMWRIDSAGDTTTVTKVVIESYH